MEQQGNTREVPVVSTGSKTLLIMEMVFVTISQTLTLMYYISNFGSPRNYSVYLIKFGIVFLVYLGACILILIGLSKRSNIGVMIAGFSMLLLLEWDFYVLNFSSFESALSSFAEDAAEIRNIALYIFALVWIWMIILTCVKKAPGPLCIIPGILGIIATFLIIVEQYQQLSSLSNWFSFSYSRYNSEVYVLAYIASLLATIFRPIWVFLAAHWLTRPTVKVPVRPLAVPTYNSTYYGAASYPVYNPRPAVPYQAQPQYRPQPQPQYRPVSTPVYQPVPQTSIAPQIIKTPQKPPIVTSQQSPQPSPEVGFYQAPSLDSQQSNPGNSQMQQLPPPQ